MMRHHIARVALRQPACCLARTYSTQRLAELDPAQLTITNTQSPRGLSPHTELVFGRSFTDHMLSIEWTAKNGWHAPQITPFQNLSMHPASNVFHYGFACFEGMKAYKDKNGRIRLFRPELHMQRMNKSSARIALPSFDTSKMVDLIGKFVALEQKFVPDQLGYSLYLRPTMIGTQETLGVGPSESALFFLIASPVGPYYPTGFKAISLEATSHAVRAWPGGVGNLKLGGNYAPCVVPQLEAAGRGYHQNLWLFGEEGYVTEVGTMNMFVALKNKESGQKELYTAPLDGTILSGVTRDCILDLAREKLVPEGWAVREEPFTIGTVAEAARDGRLIEAFGSGTAAVIAPVRRINWNGQDIHCGLAEGEEAGELAKRIKVWVEARQTGIEEHEWSHVVPST